RLYRTDGDEPSRFQGSQQSDHVAGVDLQLSAKRPHVTPFGPDLPEQARFAKGAIPREKPVVERPNALRDDAVEPPDPRDHLCGHSLTLVRDSTLAAS